MQRIPLPPDLGMGAPGAMPPPGPVAPAPAGPASFNPNDLVAAPPAAPKKKSGKSKPKAKGKGKY